jgi:hypothetical protein
MATLLRRLLQHKCPKTALGIGLHEGQFGISAGAYLSERRARDVAHQTRHN